jgi:carbon monoxide dehydrogenase subunit G
MTQVESKIVTIRRNDEDIFSMLSNFQNFTPFVESAKLEDWQAGEDWCQFKVKGLGNAGLRIIDREPFKIIKIGPDGTVPFGFNVWIQLKQVAPYDTRMKLTLKAELNMMMKMLVGSKLQSGIDSMAEQIALAFNR